MISCISVKQYWYRKPGLGLGLEITQHLMSLYYQNGQILDIFIRKYLDKLHMYKISVLKTPPKKFYFLQNIRTLFATPPF